MRLRGASRGSGVLALLALSGAALPAQTNGARSVSAAGSGRLREHAIPSPATTASRVRGAVNLDGRLDEPFWAGLSPATDFRQHEPHEGEPATQRTEIRIGFDANAIYVGARMFDTEGAAGVRSRLARRDDFVTSDWIELVFDTYHNHLGRTSFAVNPAGVRRDAGNAVEFTDESWDPVWQAAAAIDSSGWTAELRIPFSQLRFGPDSVQTWGLQVWRTASRLNELSMWSFWRRNEAGGPGAVRPPPRAPGSGAAPRPARAVALRGEPVQRAQAGRPG